MQKISISKKKSVFHPKKQVVFLYNMYYTCLHVPSPLCSDPEQWPNQFRNNTKPQQDVPVKSTKAAVHTFSRSSGEMF